MLMVDFPEPDSPVNQIVKPRCLRRVLRSVREIAELCHVIFLSEEGYLWCLDLSKVWGV